MQHNETVSQSAHSALRALLLVRRHKVLLRTLMVSILHASLATTMLCASGAIMICAWYLHLKFTSQWSLSRAVLTSWLIAGGEYCLQVPANRVGMQAGMSAAQLRAVAELAILAAFVVFQVRVLAQPLTWNHVIGFLVVLIGVGIVLVGPFNGIFVFE